jgi:ferric-dicitrate binding protein FerR (iron transport regulator)
MSGWLPPGVTDADIDNAAPQNEPDDDEIAWREHSIAMDEQTISSCVERMLRMGGRAAVMELFDDLTREHRLNSFVGRIGYD